MRKENLEEADRVEGPKMSLDLSMRLLSVAFEDQGHLGSGGGCQPGTRGVSEWAGNGESKCKL